MKLTLSAAVIAASFLGNPIQMPAQDPTARLEILSHWQGVSRDDELLKQGPDQPFILNDESWQDVWNVWRSDEEVPEVDFERDLVLVATVKGPNRLRGGAFMGRNGDVELRVAGTRIGGPGFGYLLMQIEREGVRSVNGQSIDPAADGDVPAEYINVEIKGQLRTGIFAIGGETTGVLILASNLTFELNLGDDADLREAAEGLNGQTVIVTGRLEGRRGIEIPIRQIVDVDTMVAVSADEENDEDKDE